MKIKSGTYRYTHGKHDDKLIVENDSIKFPSEDDMHNLDMFPQGKMSEYTKKKLRHYIDTGLLQLVK